VRTQEKVQTPLILIGDRLSRRPHLANLFELVRAENEQLPDGSQIGYVICRDYSSFAVALKRHAPNVRLIVVGPELEGKPDMLVRLLGDGTPVVLAVDPERRPLAENREEARRLLTNLKELGKTMIHVDEATREFYEPFVKNHVVAGLSSQFDITSMTPEQRSELLEKRLESVTAFPSLPETQRKVSELDDHAPPKKWAEAIDPDVPIRTVILNLLNSAHYSFRYRIETIEQAVSLASTRAIREIVLACTVQKLFRKISEARVDQFWQHSIATAYFARLLALPVDPEKASPAERSELERYALEPDDLERLKATELADTFDFRKDVDPFTAGMLHDIGKVTMALCFEDSLLLLEPLVEEGIKAGEESGEIWADSCRALERSLMGDTDHQTIGGRIARRWNLEDKLHQVITRHHDITEKTPLLVNLVALADLAANAVLPYPFRADQAPLTRLFRRIDERVQSEGGDRASVAREMLQGDLAGERERILARMEIPELLWKHVDPIEFLVLTYAIAPRIRKLTLEFLRMTSSMS
jgi:HD-like signal output (HDOD) protein